MERVRKKLGWIMNFAPIRLICRTFRLFSKSQCPLWASALTYYSIFSIVPILALTFGICKGFGLEEKIYELLNENFANHKDILEQVMSFSDNLLERTKGGLIAGVGVIVLVYSVISMIRHIEKAVENVLGVNSGRKILRIVTDYLALVLICPLLLVTAGSVTIVFNSLAEQMAGGTQWLEMIGKPLAFCIKYASPCVISAIFFMLLFIVLSNGKMRILPAVYGGLVAAVMLQLLQVGYFHIQKYLTSYNAVYGSFAALPLFLIYIYTAWNLILVGVSFASAVQGWKTQEFDNSDSEAENAPPSRKFLVLTAILIAKYFSEGKKAPSDEILAASIGVGLRRMRLCLSQLADSGIILYAKFDENSYGYVPAMPPEKTTIGYILAKLDENTIPMNPQEEDVKSIYDTLEKMFSDQTDQLLKQNITNI